MTIIYHMAVADEWQSAQEAGAYYGTANDKEDGFIHFSTAETVVESAAKHRNGVENLLLLFVDAGSAACRARGELTARTRQPPYFPGTEIEKCCLFIP